MVEGLLRAIAVGHLIWLGSCVVAIMALLAEAAYEERWRVRRWYRRLSR